MSERAVLTFCQTIKMSEPLFSIPSGTLYLATNGLITFPNASLRNLPTNKGARIVMSSLMSKSVALMLTSFAAEPNTHVTEKGTMNTAKILVTTVSSKARAALPAAADTSVTPLAIVVGTRQNMASPYAYASGLKGMALTAKAKVGVTKRMRMVPVNDATH